MFALLLALALTSPLPPPVCRWYSRTERRCRDADVEYLGEWDPREAPAEWSRAYFYPVPPVWGAYPTEQAPP